MSARRAHAHETKTVRIHAGDVSGRAVLSFPADATAADVLAAADALALALDDLAAALADQAAEDDDTAAAFDAAYDEFVKWVEAGSPGAASDFAAADDWARDRAQMVGGYL